MEHKSFEDEEVAQVLIEQFVSDKVDREERPDLDEIYMTAVQLRYTTLTPRNLPLCRILGSGAG
jgi:uncharacterized protein YyaL (SSP411 family)